MQYPRSAAQVFAAIILLMSVPATASDQAFELWLNPSVSADLDDDTGIELETAQRLRSERDGRVDTYFARLWLNQRVSDQFTLAGAIERRINDGGRNETRFIQQLSGRHGILRTRLRLEERLVDDTGRLGLRLRPRAGVAFDLDDSGRWSAKADTELFMTLRSTSDGGDDGLTGLRTQIGIGYDVSDRLSLGLTYLRQQDFNDGAPDDIGHAPLVTIELAL